MTQVPLLCKIRRTQRESTHDKPCAPVLCLSGFEEGGRCNCVPCRLTPACSVHPGCHVGSLARGSSAGSAEENNEVRGREGWAELGMYQETQTQQPHFDGLVPLNEVDLAPSAWVMALNETRCNEEPTNVKHQATVNLQL